MVQSFVPKFTYIIPFRYRQDRILPFRRILEWLSGFQGVEIIVVEQDKHSRIDYLNLKATHIFTKSEAPFNKSWALNVGLRRALAPVVLFGDADFIMNPMQLIESLKVLENFDCVIPTNKVVNLTPQQSAMDTNSILQIGGYQPKKNILDGLSIFKKDSINKIGGWNEDLIGLGFENEFNELKMNKLLNFKQLDFTGYHIFHHSDPTPQTLLERNKKIFDVYKNDSNMLEQHISQVSPKIGVLNRFATITV
jgi:glycosyltransferase involved in cell wall biosynthesis